VADSFAGAEQELHEVASSQTSLTDFGDEDYRPALRRLLAALDSDPRLTSTGRQFAYGMVLSTLVARLHTEQGWRERPDCLQHAIVRPLVIIGIPRTGTTALHKLLSLDPQFQGLEHWLTEAPMPRPPRAQWAGHPAYQASVAALEAYFTMMPDMRKAHDVVAGEVDECLEVLRQSFTSNRFASSVYVPSFDEWFLTQNELPSYRRYANVLRLIGADEPDKRWLLKNPGHVAQIEALLDVFPDACVVQTHRDPLLAIPSLCSTLHMSRRMFEGDAARADVLGPRECAYWSRAVEDTERVRRSRPAQFHDVHHRDLHADPLGILRGVYAHFELEFESSVEADMRAWLGANPPAKHGEHRYRLETYGIGVQDIERNFGPYRARMGLG